jgi:hypothetical protein
VRVVVHMMVASHRSKREGEGDPGRVTAKKKEIGGISFMQEVRGALHIVWEAVLQVCSVTLLHASKPYPGSPGCNILSVLGRTNGSNRTRLNYQHDHHINVTKLATHPEKDDWRQELLSGNMWIDVDHHRTLPRDPRAK